MNYPLSKSVSSRPERSISGSSVQAPLSATSIAASLPASTLFAEPVASKSFIRFLIKLSSRRWESCFVSCPSLFSSTSSRIHSSNGCCSFGGTRSIQFSTISRIAPSKSTLRPRRISSSRCFSSACCPRSRTQFMIAITIVPPAANADITTAQTSSALYSPRPVAIRSRCRPTQFRSQVMAQKNNWSLEGAE